MQKTRAALPVFRIGEFFEDCAISIPYSAVLARFPKTARRTPRGIRRATALPRDSRLFSPKGDSPAFCAFRIHKCPTQISHFRSIARDFQVFVHLVSFRLVRIATAGFSSRFARRHRILILEISDRWSRPDIAVLPAWIFAGVCLRQFGNSGVSPLVQPSQFRFP